MTSAAFVARSGHGTRHGVRRGARHNARDGAPESARVTDGFTPDSHTLAGEHALLMRDVLRRVAPVLALIDARAWPNAEVGTLTNFLRTAVLRQASDEEVLLFPADSSQAPFAELSADHVRLHTLTARLDRARVTPCPLPELRALLDDLLAILERHLVDERTVLAALSDTDAAVPSAGDLAAGDQEWLPADDGPVSIMLDTLPNDQATRLCVERLLRLRPGQVAEIHSRHDWRVRQVCRWVQGFDPAQYGLSRPPADEGQALLRVTRRPTD